MTPTQPQTPAATNRIDGLRPDAPVRAAWGAFGVGRTTLKMTNEDVPRMVNLLTGEGPERADRTLTVELFYPAQKPVQPTPIQSLLRDGQTPVTLWGQSAQDAPIAETAGDFPLVVISHGYPGNRFLMSHLAENLATKGYAVASIDHPDSTYDDQNIPEAVAVDRPRDIHFVLNALTALRTTGDHPALALLSTDRIGLVGYSMGGYGVLMAQGAQLAPPLLTQSPAAAQPLVQGYILDTDTPAHHPDPRVAAMIAIAPWGRQVGILDPKGLAKITTPTLVVGGSDDEISGYETGIRQIWQDTTAADRALLTFENAQHNAAAPIPAPQESYIPHPELGMLPFEHYADPVWDNVRMNNILQHAATGLFDHYVRNDQSAPDLAQASAEHDIPGTRFEFLPAG